MYRRSCSSSSSLLSFPYLSVLTNIAAIDRVLIHFLLLRASPSHRVKCFARSCSKDRALKACAHRKAEADSANDCTVATTASVLSSLRANLLREKVKRDRNGHHPTPILVTNQTLSIGKHETCLKDFVRGEIRQQ